MGWTAEMQRDFIVEDLGPALKQNGYGDVKLMILDDQRLFLPHWADIVRTRQLFHPIIMQNIGKTAYIISLSSQHPNWVGVAQRL